MALLLRPATVGDIKTLEYWDEKPHVIAAGGDDDMMDWRRELSRTVSWQQILIAELDDRPIGVVQIIDPAEEESHYWGDCDPGLRAIDIWIGEEEDLGKGYGQQMMAQAIDQCFSAPDVTAILIDPLASNRDAQRFYTRLGFKTVGPRRFGADDCTVMQLDRPVWASREG